MAQLTTDQRVFIVRMRMNNFSIVQIQQAFRQQFHRQPPSKTTIRLNYSKYLRWGTSLNRNKGNSGRRRTARNLQNVNAVQNILIRAPKTTSRRNGLGMTKSTFNRISKTELRFHPYRIHRRQELKNGDYARRMNFCRWFLQQSIDPAFLSRFTIGDEATFSLNGNINTKNNVYYAPKGNPPTYNYDVPESRDKVTVWIGLSGDGSLIGPHFFPNNVNGQNYLDMLNNLVIPTLSLNHLFDFDQLWWAQDGAPAHRLGEVTRRLREIFDDRLVILGNNPEWPPRSPDLTPLDFFLWGYLKDKVFTSPCPNVIALRRRIQIQVEILKEDQALLRKVFRSMQRRANVCIARQGRQVEGHD